ncbi:hypothetical protein K7432_010179 [Basidiobolus ranarum]|uniref:Uncharacterized protein n=1 Tax=Basidiobolus ranarum TaxID=34480 RepID=A0ABR2VW18_9FUNG
MKSKYNSQKLNHTTHSSTTDRILSGAEMIQSLQEMDARYKVNFTNWVTSEQNVINIGARFSQLVTQAYTIQQIGNAMLLISKDWSDAARQYLFYTATSDWDEARRESLYWFLVTPRNPNHIITSNDFTPQVCDVRIARTILRTHPYYVPRTWIKPISSNLNRDRNTSEGRNGPTRISISSLLASRRH